MAYATDSKSAGALRQVIVKEAEAPKYCLISTQWASYAIAHYALPKALSIDSSKKTQDIDADITKLANSIHTVKLGNKRKMAHLTHAETATLEKALELEDGFCESNPYLANEFKILYETAGDKDKLRYLVKQVIVGDKDNDPQWDSILQKNWDYREFMEDRDRIRGEIMFATNAVGVFISPDANRAEVARILNLLQYVPDCIVYKLDEHESAFVLNAKLPHGLNLEGANPIERSVVFEDIICLL